MKKEVERLIVVQWSKTRSKICRLSHFGSGKLWHIPITEPMPERLVDKVFEYLSTVDDQTLMEAELNPYKLDEILPKKKISLI